MDTEEIFDRLKPLYPHEYFSTERDPFYILISTVLSQRTRDEVTEVASRRLFDQYSTPVQMVEADVEKIEILIKDVGFYRVKAGRIKEISQILIDEYDSQVPASMVELLKLPGVGRKTANCVLSYAFLEKAIAVDTHVHRISNRLGLVDTVTPDQTEIELQKQVPVSYWREVNELFVQFGKTVCKPLSPACEVCAIEDLCAKKEKKK
ncbi:endonuclease III domain-containing protein [Methanohalophilus mahii]|uniref:Endonuclease III n=1 Tax=Methanohalophilus mahii (strain ATCC 35705 / DSM 5219 / SLP) TaxID=547558 RepID=D5E7Z1_METMS|nr:endonuclease III [Methanohalophilus mahii]ADE37279.1 DNA-(apurinic or apyrimidinic site) lyase [Methanohalophilus mahii DSM 5219]